MTAQSDNRWRVIGILAVTQILSWGAIYHAIAIVAPDIQRELSWRPDVVYGAFSWSLLVAGIAATPVGMLIDRIGGNRVMATGSVLAGLGFILLSQAHSILLYFIAWTILGLAMGLTLYEAAFATINRKFTTDSRKAIATLTLFGGFASTVFWPLTLAVNNHVGWRETFLIYAASQWLICVPLHLWLRADKKTHANKAPRVGASVTLREAIRYPLFWKLALAFAGHSFIQSALAVHLIPLLQDFGHGMAFAVLASMLIGPSQVAGRIGEIAFLQRTSPQNVGRIALMALPAGLLSLFLLGSVEVAAAGFCILYGLCNGIMTIVRGTVPQALFGHEHYGAISGALAGPTLICKAAGPFAIALAVQQHSSSHGILAILTVIALTSCGFYSAAVSLQHPQAAQPADR